MTSWLARRSWPTLLAPMRFTASICAGWFRPRASAIFFDALSASFLFRRSSLCTCDCEQLCRARSVPSGPRKLSSGWNLWHW